ncbi:MAG: UDP-N-acetylmuramoyl-tripeptide--D-alanyl-D-alanine ligase [Oscillospiraceae bacterium]|nr:UDP-N-acetylmuramoyl-tripeptide--D-alanyl-D-alanine ligase [Oscillospiraceae bacterium]
METYLRLGLLLIWFVSALSSSLTFVHMWQLEAYRWGGYWRWLKERSGDVYQKFLWVMPTLFLWLWWGAWVPYAVAGCYLVTLWNARLRKGAKKPFKVTSRAARLLVTLALLLALVGWGASRLWPTPRLFLIALGAGFMLISLAVPLADLINRPLQRAIEGVYLRDAKRRLASMPSLIVIGVTGSYGKTSTKFFLQRLLSARYNTLMTPGSYNTPMGVVRTVREQLRATHEVFVCEMGARHVGDIRALCDIVRPRLGVITAVGPQHLESFRTLENVVAAKFELADALPDDGVLFANWDSREIRGRAVRARTVRYGVAGAAEDAETHYTAHDIRADARGLSFRVTASDGTEQTFTTALIGRHNVENITAAVAVARHMGISWEELARLVRGLEPVPHRLQLRPGPEITFIDDAFNANPEGAAAALEALAGLDGVRMLVTPGFVELGERQEACHEELGRRAAAVCDFVALVGERQTEAVARGLRAAGFAPERFCVAPDLTAALAAVRAFPAAGRMKYVLLENDLPDQYET